MEPHQRDEWKRAHPEVTLVEAGDGDGLQAYLTRLGLLGPQESVLDVARAGEGNMNCTLRVRTSQKSWIIKQSRPWVEKYPHLDAPWDRSLSEARFYMLTSANQKIAQRMPDLIELDPIARILVLEDLGVASDFTGIYQAEELPVGVARELVTWLSDLHAMSFHRSLRANLANRPMRRLNHAHMFHLPLVLGSGPDLDAITPGLGKIAQELATDTLYVASVRALGEAYLADGEVLLHGDFFPGSWLNSPTGLKVIDPEFAFFGPPEFDLGVLLAHLYLGNQPAAVHQVCLETYASGQAFDFLQALRFCGVEIMRRLLGVAQLPIHAGLPQKKRLLAFSRQLVCGADPLRAPDLLAKSFWASQLPPAEDDSFKTLRA